MFQCNKYLKKAVYTEHITKNFKATVKNKNENVDSLCVPTMKFILVEAVGLFLSNYIFKHFNFLSMWIWGNFVKKIYFVNNRFIRVLIWKSFCTYVAHIILIICHTVYLLSTKSIFN